MDSFDITNLSSYIDSLQINQTWLISHLPSDWIPWEPDIIERFSHLPSDWIAWEPNIIEKFSHLPSDWIAWELDIIESSVTSPRIALHGSWI